MKGRKIINRNVYCRQKFTNTKKQVTGFSDSRPPTIDSLYFLFCAVLVTVVILDHRQLIMPVTEQ